MTTVRFTARCLAGPPLALCKRREEIEEEEDDANDTEGTVLGLIDSSRRRGASFGGGAYGDLGAAVAAILLDREARRCGTSRVVITYLVFCACIYKP